MQPSRAIRAILYNLHNIVSKDVLFFVRLYSVEVFSFEDIFTESLDFRGW